MSKYEPMTTFSDNVRRAMKQAGWTQQSLAEECGWTQPDISKLLGCKSNPTLSSMEAVAKALGLPLYELLMPIRHPERAA